MSEPFDWLPALEAVKRLLPTFGENAPAELIRRCQRGTLDTCASLYVSRYQGHTAQVWDEDYERYFPAVVEDEKHRDVSIPERFWHSTHATSGEHRPEAGLTVTATWETGEFTRLDQIVRDTSGPLSDADASWQLQEAAGVRFNASQIANLAGMSLRAEGELAVPLDAKKGRPPAEWWDDLYVAVFRRLYLDGWQPRTQAEIISTMEDWLAEKGLSASTSSLKVRARKIFYGLELGNRP